MDCPSSNKLFVVVSMVYLTSYK